MGTLNSCYSAVYNATKGGQVFSEDQSRIRCCTGVSLACLAYNILGLKTFFFFFFQPAEFRRHRNLESGITRLRWKP